MNQGSEIIGQLLALAIALIGISIILRGAKGPSCLASLILRPIFGGMKLIAKLSILLFLLTAIYQYAAHRPTIRPPRDPAPPDIAAPSGAIVANSFDYPVGDEPPGERRNGKGWVVTQDFQDPIKYPDHAPSLQGTHLGEDWAHGSGAGVSAGKPVFAVGDGELLYAGAHRSYGHAVLVRHPLPAGNSYPYVVSMYGHLGATDLLTDSVGAKVIRGQMVGRVGKPGENGKSKSGMDWPAHLHFELRMDSSQTGFPDDDLSAGGQWGYHAPAIGFLDPTSQGGNGASADSGWIDAHR